MASNMEKNIRRALLSSEAKDWNSWDDVHQWADLHANEIGGKNAANEIMDNVECMSRDGIPFEKDPDKAIDAIKAHSKRHAA